MRRPLLLPFFVAQAVIAALTCQPEGPTLPRPTSVADSETFIAAAENFTSALSAYLSHPLHANLSLSLALVTHDQPDPAVPVWEFHHRSDENENGTETVSRDSEYNIGSVSKVLTDLMMLRSEVDPGTEVTELLPTLKGDVAAEGADAIRWEDVTIEMLGSHLSGLGPNCKSWESSFPIALDIYM